MRKTCQILLCMIILLVGSAGLVAATAQGGGGCVTYPNSTPTMWPGYGQICAGSGSGCVECVIIVQGELGGIMTGS